MTVTAPAPLAAVPGINGPDPTTYEEFWPYYVSQHLHPLTRAMHAWGPVLVTVAAVAGVATGRWWAPLLGVVVGYGIAWISHFAVERNKPASWGRPAWSFRGDMQLIKGYFRGTLAADVAVVRAALGLREDQRTLADAR